MPDNAFDLNPDLVRACLNGAANPIKEFLTATEKQLAPEEFLEALVKCFQALYSLLNRFSKDENNVIGAEDFVPFLIGCINDAVADQKDQGLAALRGLLAQVPAVEKNLEIRKEHLSEKAYMLANLTATVSNYIITNSEAKLKALIISEDSSVFDTASFQTIIKKVNTFPNILESIKAFDDLIKIVEVAQSENKNAIISQTLELLNEILKLKENSILFSLTLQMLCVLFKEINQKQKEAIVDKTLRIFQGFKKTTETISASANVREAEEAAIDFINQLAKLANELPKLSLSQQSFVGFSAVLGAMLGLVLIAAIASIATGGIGGAAVIIAAIIHAKITATIATAAAITVAEAAPFSIATGFLTHSAAKAAVGFFRKQDQVHSLKSALIKKVTEALEKKATVIKSDAESPVLPNQALTNNIG